MVFSTTLPASESTYWALRGHTPASRELVAAGTDQPADDLTTASKEGRDGHARYSGECLSRCLSSGIRSAYAGAGNIARPEAPAGGATPFRRTFTRAE
jgi:hypothetical protein